MKNIYIFVTISLNNLHLVMDHENKMTEKNVKLYLKCTKTSGLTITLHQSRLFKFIFDDVTGYYKKINK